MTRALPIALFVIALAVLLYALGILTPRSFAGAPSGLPTTIATSSTPTVSGTVTVPVIATSSPRCTVRIISTTVADGIRISFTDKQGFVPSATQGMWQPASTTVAYDSGLYGCGAVRVYSGVSQVITVAEGE